MKLDYHQLDTETFAALSRSAGRKVRVAAVVGLFALMAPTVLIGVLPGVVRALTANPAYWWPRAYSAYAIAVGVAGMFVMHRATSDPRLRCPGCRKPLLPMRSLLMATGKCGRCATQVLTPTTPADENAEATPAAASSSSSSSSSADLLDPAVFRATAERLQLRTNLVPVLIIVCGMLIPMLAILPFGESVRAATRPYPRAVVLVPLAFFTYLFAVIGVAGWAGARTAKDPRVCCPRCRKPMIRHQAVVIATGRCGHCGARALVNDGDG